MPAQGDRPEVLSTASLHARSERASHRGDLVTEYDFIKVIFVAALLAVVLQCAVYPIRRLLGMAVAWRVLRASLFGFLGVSVASLVWGAWTGELSDALAGGGLADMATIALFIGLTMFVSYFMGSRYLADELERAKRTDGVVADGPAPPIRGSED